MVLAFGLLGSYPEADASETAQAAWLDPGEALEMHAAGSLRSPPSP